MQYVRKGDGVQPGYVGENYGVSSVNSFFFIIFIYIYIYLTYVIYIYVSFTIIYRFFFFVFVSQNYYYKSAYSRLMFYRYIHVSA